MNTMAAGGRAVASRDTAFLRVAVLPTRPHGHLHTSEKGAGQGAPLCRKHSAAGEPQ